MAKITKTNILELSSGEFGEIVNDLRCDRPERGLYYEERNKIYFELEIEENGIKKILRTDKIKVVVEK